MVYSIQSTGFRKRKNLFKNLLMSILQFNVYSINVHWLERYYQKCSTIESRVYDLISIRKKNVPTKIGHIFSLAHQVHYQILELKVNSFRKQIFLFSFEPKTQRKYFLISAIASKKSSNQKNLFI